MSYMHIENLYKNDTILLFQRVFAMEKIHGTSAHVSWKDKKIGFSPGGCKLETFKSIFDEAILVEKFSALGHDTVVVFGEQYGGSQQKMSDTYGKDPRFAAFEVKIKDTWLNVPNAADVAGKLGLEFVPWKEIQCELSAIDAERDADSEVAIRNGIGTGHIREGIVLRPLQEFTDNRGERVIAKHKRSEFRETATPRHVGESLKAMVGDGIALEWVTDRRMEHVLDRVRAVHGNDLNVKHIPVVIEFMLDDVLREGFDEVPDDKATRKAISFRTVAMFKACLKSTNKVS